MFTIQHERERLQSMTDAECVEDFWEYIRAYINEIELMKRLAGRGVIVTSAEIREARMRDAPLVGYDKISDRLVTMVQPC
jgi:hypothetical protein